jgi:hypothetical protein
MGDSVPPEVIPNQPPLLPTLTGLSNSSPTLLPTLTGLSNPSKKRLSMDKLTKDNFITWKNVTIAEFKFLKVYPVILGTHSSPSPLDNDYSYWEDICNMFDIKFASSIPPDQWVAVKDLPTLAKKWSGICAFYVKPNLTRVFAALTELKLDTKETVSHFAFRLSNLFDEAHQGGQTFTEASKIEWLLSKLESSFPAETQNLLRLKDVSGITWDYTVRRFKEIEHQRPVASGTSNQALAVTNTKDKNKDQGSQNTTFHGRGSYRGNMRGRYGRYQNQRGRGNYRGSISFRGNNRGRGYSRYSQGFNQQRFQSFRPQGLNQQRFLPGCFCFICN